jgi:hypothetical protein
MANIRHSSEGTDKIHEKSQLGQPMSRSRFEPGTLEYESTALLFEPSRLVFTF